MCACLYHASEMMGEKTPRFRGPAFWPPGRKKAAPAGGSGTSPRRFGENHPPEALNAAGPRRITRTVTKYLLDGMLPLAAATGSRGPAAKAKSGGESRVTQHGAGLQERIPHGPESFSGMIRTVKR